MGYSTEFEGCFEITPALSDAQVAEINDYIEDSPYKTGPNSYCDWWFGNKDGKTFMSWSGSEKTRDMPKWARFLHRKFFSMHEMNGTMLARGEEIRDIWHMKATGKKIEVFDGFPNE